MNTNYAKSEIFTGSQLDKLTQNSNNEVYEYQYDSVDRVKSVAEVKTLMKTLRLAYLKLRETDPELCDNAIRRKILEDNVTMQDFKKTHPKIFELFANRKSEPKDFEIILYQLNIRLNVENGTIPQEEGTRLVQLYLYEKFKTGKTYEQYQAEEEAKKKSSKE